MVRSDRGGRRTGAEVQDDGHMDAYHWLQAHRDLVEDAKGGVISMSTTWCRDVSLGVEESNSE